MAHVGACCLVHEGGVVAVGFGQANLVRDVGVNPLVCGGLGGEGRVVLLHHLFLQSDPPLLLVPLFVSDHLQVLDLGFGGRRQALLHPLPGSLERLLKLFPFVLELDDVGLAH